MRWSRTSAPCRRPQRTDVGRFRRATCCAAIASGAGRGSRGPPCRAPSRASHRSDSPAPRGRRTRCGASRSRLWLISPSWSRIRPSRPFGYCFGIVVVAPVNWWGRTKRGADVRRPRQPYQSTELLTGPPRAGSSTGYKGTLQSGMIVGSRRLHLGWRLRLLCRLVLRATAGSPARRNRAGCGLTGTRLNDRLSRRTSGFHHA
jgi:hypothetical protein